ncbi:YceD family protein [Pseudorhodoplanes sinuspersici]|uniref:Uncharacterized protein n=1 Tax=Pseudorhodoplanes sinuspersici TaxID=1235591 RepID=A0A1W6ZXT5_9HYPH|nr:DUF177 domain-containing protein [Pseudorhodoplanes sinuspersici]ARQ01565.1 hypothetical protein CAK95_22475 [Pseudorhodoplanes sinuspersici]RKE73272.1 uncharacterized metal-binding protein YceD (DUF177 family) [Pseudorhodoplanes sinuspersici]
MTDTIWSSRLAREDVPEDGIHVEISADAAVRAALAQSAELRDLSRLEAQFDVTRSGRDGLHVVGEVSALVGQNCVVTLEPIETNLVEPIDLFFTSDQQASLGDSDGEASFGLTEAEPPEPLVGGAVDLGAIATEYFLLGLDPYPRKKGVTFESPAAGDAVAKPFAALAALKRPPKGSSE